MFDSLPAQVCADIIELHRSGLTQKAIASRLKTAQSNVSRVLSRARRGGNVSGLRATGTKIRMYLASQLGTRRHPLNLDLL